MLNSAENCIDGNLQTKPLCETNRESYPFLVLEYDHPVRVTGLTIYNRADCCGERMSSLHAIVTDEYPEVGKIAQGNTASFVFLVGNKLYEL